MTAVDAPAPGAPAVNEGIDRPALGMLAAVHACDDFYQGAVPALMPFFRATYSLSYESAAGVVFAANLLSSVLQPIFGYLADRRAMSWMIWAGVGAAGIGVSLATIAPSYPIALVLIAIGGVGIAAFHPEATRATARASGNRRGTGMSWFAFGGNVGFAIAPITVGAMATRFGLRSIAWLAIPAALVTIGLAVRGRRGVGVAAPARPAPKSSLPPRTDAWWPFARLTATVVCRAITFFGLNTFLPLYWVAKFNKSAVAGSGAVSVLLGAGLVGTIIGGWAADRVRPDRVIAFGFLALAPSLWAMLHAPTPELAMALLVPVGLALYIPFSVLVTLGQYYLPNHIGTASGVTLGLAVAVGGLAAPWIGRVADHAGVEVALRSLVWVAFAASALAFTLPRPTVARA